MEKKFPGRRRAMKDGYMPENLEIGDYFRLLDSNNIPIKSDFKENLTGMVWHVVVPIGDEDGFAIGNLANHTVREHEDGTISVRPGDGSSNSILVTGSKGRTWHGYIDHGIFEEC